MSFFRSDESEKREVTFAGTDSVQLVTIQPKTRPGIQREHDDFTLACLAITFTNSGFKTEGTPMRSLPHPDFAERYHAKHCFVQHYHDCCCFFLLLVFLLLLRILPMSFLLIVSEQFNCQKITVRILHVHLQNFRR